LIEQGYAAAQLLCNDFLTALEQTLQDETQFSAQQKMLSVLARLGTKPGGYHKRGKIGGKPIDHWFAPENFCPGKILQALAQSPYVVPGAPERSRILTQLTTPDGPMFRIFSDEDIKVITEWIRQLSPSREIDLGRFRIPPPPPRTRKESLPAPENDDMRFDLREMYFRLLNSDEYPQEREKAHAYAKRWLRSCMRDLEKGPRALPFGKYSHASLDQWLEQQHNEQVQSYIPLTECPDEAREEVVETALQLSPLTRIDGAWLRAFTAPALVNTRVGGLLYHIYAGELGNGVAADHHGNIYRDLVSSMGYELADFSEADFANSAVFDDSSFEVPVFWLSISLFPRRFRPEILGLNLAMELSGIGGEYRRSGDVLAHYGFDPRFTVLHNSIDNIVTGHTAWAADAIKAHMEDICRLGVESETGAHWRRVWSGYRALHPPRKRTLVVEAISRLFN